MANDDRVNILIVDDVPEKLLALRVVLEELGQNLVTAGSGREALRRLSEQEFAVILLDVNMPDIDGFETAALIRQRKRFAHVPIIFITAYADEMNAAQGYSLGAVDYILSPVVPEILRTKVNVFVELYKKTRQVERLAEERVALAREQAARAAAEEATRRSTFLAEAGAVLANSLDLEATLRGLAGLVVPALGDLGMVTAADDQGRPGPTELAWAKPSATGGVRRLSGPAALAAVPLAEVVRDVLASGKARTGSPVAPPAAPAAPDACPCPAAAVALPLRARGRAAGVLLVGFYSPARSLAPAELALAEELAARGAVALDNARLYRNIQESDRRKNEFLSMLAHELRNPLAPIRNAVQILKVHASAAGPTVQWARDIIDRQVQQIIRMVDDLLDVARITRGKINLRREPVDIATVVARAVETSRPLIDARKHDLTVSVPPEPIRLEGDPTRLAQVLTNLLNNAAKYTEEGGRIWLEAEREGGDVAVRVRDSGVGIPPEMIGSIFEPFTQADRSLDRSQGGLGIGLTLVRRLVELHGGSVRVSSPSPGGGSEFVVRLPAWTSPADSAAGHVNGTSRHTAGCSVRRVLVVDDNMDSADSLTLLLRLMGHTAHTVYSSEAALAAAERFCPDVVLLDIGLPRMDGYEVARSLRALPGGSDLRIIAVTGYGQPDDFRRSHAAGFDQHLVKPVDLQALEGVFTGADADPAGGRRG